MLSLSFTHEFTLDFLDEDHCSVSESSHQDSHEELDELCNSHCEFHITYILPEHTSTQYIKHLYIEPYSKPLTHDFKSTDYFLKPPIA